MYTDENIVELLSTGEEVDLNTTEEDILECDNCYNHDYENELVEVENDLICTDCTSEAVDCEDCGDLVYESNAQSDGRITICDDCYYDNYHRCNNCSDIVSDDNSHYDEYEGEHYCEHCYEPGEHRALLAYNDNPPLNYNGDCNDYRYMGVELEADNGNVYDCVDELDHRYGRHEVYYKEDGSLNDGFEVVTQPMTFDYHMNEFDWGDIVKTLRHYNFTSHDARTCGLHIHIDRRAFGIQLYKQEENMEKLLYFVERFWDEMRNFARRSEGQLDRWAKSYVKEFNGDYTENFCPKEIYDRAKGYGRYFAVNFEPRHTVELRLFRGTLKISTLKATIQFTNLLIDIINKYSLEELQEMVWSEITGQHMLGKYAELDQYLQERNLV